MSKCKYSRSHYNDTYTPACCVDENEDTVYDVHPEDIYDWVYCPFCGNKIKIVEDY